MSPFKYNYTIKIRSIKDTYEYFYLPFIIRIIFLMMYNFQVLYNKPVELLKMQFVPHDRNNIAELRSRQTVNLHKVMLTVIMKFDSIA